MLLAIGQDVARVPVRLDGAVFVEAVRQLGRPLGRLLLLVQHRLEEHEDMGINQSPGLPKSALCPSAEANPFPRRTFGTDLRPLFEQHNMSTRLQHQQFKELPVREEFSESPQITIMEERQ